MSYLLWKGDKMKNLTSVVAVLTLLFSVQLFAQGAYMELLKSDIKTEKKAIITEAMQFTDDEAAVFWPVYREFEFEMDKLQDTQFAIIKDYAEHFETLTDEKAKDLWLRNLKVRADKEKLGKKYFKKMDKVLPSTVAVKFFQVNNLIDNLINLQISSSIPFVERMDDFEEN